MCQVELDGIIYSSTEHAYQAAKTLNMDERNLILDCSTPTAAKRMGRTLTIRPNWDSVKLQIMHDLIKQKFSKEPLRTMIIQTGDEEIQEGNWWGDTYWGTVNGIGENHLGKILMQVRHEVKYT